MSVWTTGVPRIKAGVVVSHLTSCDDVEEERTEKEIRGGLPELEEIAVENRRLPYFDNVTSIATAKGGDVLADGRPSAREEL